MRVTRFQSSFEDEAFSLFCRTVHESCRADYSLAQLDAWAPQDTDPHSWCSVFYDKYSLAAVDDDGVLLGFGNIDEAEGYLDMLYVAPEAQGRGAGKILLRALEARSQKSFVTTFSSDTARPFFIRMGYSTVAEDMAERRGVLLRRWRMERQL